MRTHSQSPINPYGRSKLIVEQILRDLDRYQGFRSFILRYFNAAGADPEGRIGEWHTPETHAIPIAIETALGRRPHFQVLGTDYDTRDGSCVRDFVHVLDLADAHTRAVEISWATARVGAESRNRPWDKREGVARNRSKRGWSSFSIREAPRRSIRQRWSLITLLRSERLAGHPT